MLLRRHAATQDQSLKAAMSGRSCGSKKPILSKLQARVKTLALRHVPETHSIETALGAGQYAMQQSRRWCESFLPTQASGGKTCRGSCKIASSKGLGLEWLAFTSLGGVWPGLGQRKSRVRGILQGKEDVP